MTDFLIRYPDEPTLDAVAQLVTGLWVPATADTPGHVGDVKGMPGIGEWAMTDPFAYDGGLARVFRWNADTAALAPYITLGGGSAVTDPATGALTITAGPVTMTTPLPPDCPVTF